MFFFRTIQLQDVPELLDFENKKLQDTISDDIERDIVKWNSKWRQESLEHYANLGWSFLLRNDELKSEFSSEGLLVGYFTAQPLLFLDGQTQSLWVEHISYSVLKARDEISEVAYRLARDKHFQRVFFPSTPGVLNSVNSLKPEIWGSQTLMVKTTK